MHPPGQASKATQPPKLPFTRRQGAPSTPSPAASSSVSAGDSTTGAVATRPSQRGRVVLSSPKQVKRLTLCSGCGVEISNAGSGGGGRGGVAVAGGEALQISNASKRKKGLFADFDSASGALCVRCKALRTGNLFAAHDAIADVDPLTFKAQLKAIVSRRRFSLAVYVVDATDFEGSQVVTLRDMIGRTPIVLAVNKCDLLPRCAYHEMRYFHRRIESKGLRCHSAHAVSALTGAGIKDLAMSVLSIIGGRDVFVCGAANVGKSTLVKALTTEIAGRVRFKGRQARRRRDKLEDFSVTVSHLPGTTLQAVRIPCFPSPGHALWDTPGIINRHNVAYHKFPVHLMQPIALPQRLELRDALLAYAGQSVLLEAKWMSDANADDALGTAATNAKLNANDLLLDDPSASTEQPMCLARVDVSSLTAGSDEGPQRPLEVKFYGSAALRVRLVRTEDAPDVAEPPTAYAMKIFAKAKAMSTRFGDTKAEYLSQCRQKLEGYIPVVGKQVDHFFGFGVDIAFTGLGWIGFYRDEDFELKPLCVKGSLFYVREPLYPRRLERSLDGHEYEFEGEQRMGRNAHEHLTNETMIASENYLGRRALAPLRGDEDDEIESYKEKQQARRQAGKDEDDYYYDDEYDDDREEDGRAMDDGDEDSFDYEDNGDFNYRHMDDDTPSRRVDSRRNPNARPPSSNHKDRGPAPFTQKASKAKASKAKASKAKASKPKGAKAAGGSGKSAKGRGR